MKKDIKEKLKEIITKDNKYKLENPVTWNELIEILAILLED